MSAVKDSVRGAQPATDPHLWVRLIGPFAICRSAGAVDVGSRKARTLVALLAVHHRRLVTVDHLSEVLWGDRPPRRPEAGVSTLVSRVRKTLGPGTVVGDRNGYRLDGPTQVDLHQAAALIAEAEARLGAGRPELCLRSAEQGLELLDGGPVLAEHAAAEWVEPARSEQAVLLRRGRHCAAKAALRTGDPGRAQALATAAITADPLDEAAYRALIRAHAAAGEPDRALGTYQRLRTTLASELGIDPAPSTRDLHRAILRDPPAPF